jgi:uncharacterized protein (DUF934 family)
MALIKHRRRALDPWRMLEAGDDGAAPVTPASGDVIVPLSVWRSARDTFIGRTGRVGVCLSGDDEPADIAGDLAHIDLIAVRFARFTDGRGYSIARLLRERYGWRGELRAIGDVQRDQLSYMSRCGFDAFELREGEDVDSALAAFDDFSEAYQASVDQPQPLFRRRDLAGA